MATFTSMKWKEKMLARLDDIAYENEQMFLHTQRIIHLLPIGFDDKVKGVGKQISKLKATLAKQ